LAGTHGDFYSNKVKDISMSDQQEAKGKIAALPTPPPAAPNHEMIGGCCKQCGGAWGEIG